MINSFLYSNFREVPDNQEVHTDANFDQSVIVELVEFQDQVSDDQIGPYVLLLVIQWSEVIFSVIIFGRSLRWAGP